MRQPAQPTPCHTTRFAQVALRVRDENQNLAQKLMWVVTLEF